ncbi:MAG: glycosyltransferase family 4 protein, partial [Verrucomicrobiota bacterium]
LCEPMGIVALEGMASGKPIVVSDVDGLREVVPLGEGAMRVPPGDVHSLAQGLAWLSNRRDEGVVAANRRHAASFLWEQIAQEYAAIYENVSARNIIAISGPMAGVRSLTF